MTGVKKKWLWKFVYKMESLGGEMDCTTYIATKAKSTEIAEEVFFKLIEERFEETDWHFNGFVNVEVVDDVYSIKGK